MPIKKRSLLSKSLQSKIHSNSLRVVKKDNVSEKQIIHSCSIEIFSATKLASASTKPGPDHGSDHRRKKSFKEKK